jgi:hypothetical protein
MALGRRGPWVWMDETMPIERSLSSTVARMNAVKNGRVAARGLGQVTLTFRYIVLRRIEPYSVCLC